MSVAGCCGRGEGPNARAGRFKTGITRVVALIHKSALDSEVYKAFRTDTFGSVTAAAYTHSRRAHESPTIRGP